MPPKKKKGKKKGKKGKKGKKDKVVEEEETEYNNMELDMLKEVVPMLRQQLEKAMLDRNYVQLERDTTQTFYDLTKKEVYDLELQIAAKEREMELMEDNHRVEIRVYVQKVKHLEYEHKNNLRQINQEGGSLLAEEQEQHDNNELDIKREKKGYNLELVEQDLENAAAIVQEKENNAKNLQKMREGFQKNLDDLTTRCQKRLEQLEADLELQRKVNIHEIEERKNLHINDLMKNHEKAFSQMKKYYNDITNDNLKLIKSLKDEVQESKNKAIANQKLMYDISQENKELSEPLDIAVKEVAELRAQLRDREKDILSLKNAKARSRVLEEQFLSLQESHQHLQAECAAAEHERDDLYESFEASIRAVQQKSDFRNLILESKLQSMEDGIAKASTQLTEIVEAANLDRDEVSHLMGSLDEMVAAKNAIIKDLQYGVLRCSKGYNDALRTYTEKLLKIGIPQEEIDAMGFAPAQTLTTEGPAGLVVK
mmetsp:Transcript_28725/g.37687  ORF Transcript_28725/g.37687 Transcript_28725/m.37687 type:complete len:483 (+) Transcript_28725:59-1507(+)